MKITQLFAVVWSKVLCSNSDEIRWAPDAKSKYIMAEFSAQVLINVIEAKFKCKQ